MTNADKMAIVAEIKRKLNCDIKNSVSVWGEISEHFNNDSSYQLVEHETDDIATAICKNNKYLRKKSDVNEDYYIYINPEKTISTRLKGFSEKVLLLVIGATLALIVNSIISKKAKKYQHLIDKQQDSLLKEISNSILFFQRHLTDTTFHKR